MPNDSHSKLSLTAAEAALKAHEAALQIEGDGVLQLWHLLASLHEWSAVHGIDFNEQLRDLQVHLSAGSLGLPAAQAAHQSLEGGQRLPSRLRERG